MPRRTGRTSLLKQGDISEAPLYLQLKELLRERITSGQLKPGDLLPSERQLQEEFKLSRTTVRLALDDLMKEGFLSRYQGRGTVVAPPKIEQGLQGFYSFTDAMQAKGLVPKSKVISLELEPASAFAQARLELPPGSQVYKLTRLRLASDEPMMFEISYIPHHLAPGLAAAALESTPLYQLLETEYRVVPYAAKEWFEPVLITAAEAHWLDVPVGSPALLLERLTYDHRLQPIEVCKSIVRGDRCRYFVNLGPKLL